MKKTGQFNVLNADVSLLRIFKLFMIFLRHGLGIEDPRINDPIFLQIWEELSTLTLRVLSLQVFGLCTVLNKDYVLNLLDQQCYFVTLLLCANIKLTRKVLTKNVLKTILSEERLCL